jgi:hypothetical protein
LNPLFNRWKGNHKIPPFFLACPALLPQEHLWDILYFFFIIFTTIKTPFFNLPQLPAPKGKNIEISLAPFCKKIKK